MSVGFGGLKMSMTSGVFSDIFLNQTVRGFKCSVVVSVRTKSWTLIHDQKKLKIKLKRPENTDPR
jgi:hypothetical protein